MGTRGLLAFHTEALTTLTYNHFDSYPSGLGLTVLEWLHSLTPADLAEAKDLASKLRHVDENDIADADFRPAAHPVSTGFDWYAALRDDQGDPEEILSRGIACAAHESWPQDSLFCEWGYVIDFEAEVLEVYRGFQREPHDEGRFAHLGQGTDFQDQPSGYYPIRLVAVFPFGALPSEKEFIDKVQGEDD